ncbi:sigma 54-interacting transcriptional regulator [Duganella sp. sic0402]|uniref:sigma 54-interacting transcriptional regulator n=1 Tax=Duganella sp. sic0402 TaxID=2854786 RepID=UPI001C438A25|nr:sigma 54-interacting transcriptional regulator [Duganella sp. sic0402]
MIGTSPALQTALAHLRTFAKVDATVLIEGETGTGKELAARTIHALSERNAAPFVLVNCAALGESPLERQLFGQEAPAFDAERSGLVDAAEGGTLFLDEVDALNLEAQAALLRFLQDHSYRCAGSLSMRRANLRVVAATNASLRQLATSGKFRTDLLYRLNVLALRMPPLRERASDAMLLAHCFLQRYSEQYGLPLKTMSARFEAMLIASPWPGNVRELENFIHQEFLVCETNVLRLDGDSNFSSAPEAGFHWTRRGAVATSF